MENFKLQNLINRLEDNKTVISEVAPNDLESILAQLISQLQLANGASGFNIMEKLQDVSSYVSEWNAMEQGFDFESFLVANDLLLPEYVYLNWMHFDQMDKVHLKFFAKYFDEIWYPSSDDLDIFDEKLRWYIFVDHDGYIKLGILEDR